MDNMLVVHKLSDANKKMLQDYICYRILIFVRQAFYVIY